MIASFRMYEAVAGAAAAWRALFERVFAEAGADLAIVEHRWPEPIASLWARPDLGCAFMCGWPFVRAAGSVQAIAAPVPSPAHYAGLPRYRSEFLVRAASGWQAIEDAFGHRFGWTSADSQSGFNAPRAFLARFAAPAGRSLFSEVHGPLGSPMKALEALRDGTVDVVALDGYFLDLVRHHEPARVEAMRCVAVTPWTPIPLLVAARAADPATVERLRSHLLGIHTRLEYSALLAQVLLERFVAPEVAAYTALEEMERAAFTSGYAEIR